MSNRRMLINNHTIINQKVCFVSSLFVGDKMSKPDTPGKFDKIKDCDYFLFTNIEKHKLNTSWDIINTNFLYSNSIIKSRVVKFQPWQVKELRGYDIIIYCDAYFHPVNDSKKWSSIIKQINNSNSGIVQSKNPYRNCPYQECDELIRLKKESPERMELTKKLLEVNGVEKNSGLWRNTFLCYNKNNDNVKKLFDKLWEYYSSNTYTYRDQPLYSLSVKITNIIPEEVECKKMDHSHFIMGKMGNHTYIL